MVKKQALWGAMGVNAVALLVLPGLAAPFRLVKWAILGAVTALLAVRFTAGSDNPSCLLPEDRPIFLAACLFVFWSACAPLATTCFITVHTAGVLQMILCFSFAWLVSMELSAAGREAGLSSLLALGAGGALAAVVVLVQASGHSFPGLTAGLGTEYKAPGPMGNPNWSAAYLLPLAPLLLGVRQELRKKDGKRPTSVICLVMTVLVVAATLATRSKAGAIGLATGIAVYGLLELRPRRGITAFLITGTAASAAAFLIGLASNGALRALPWIRGRLLIWESCLALIVRNPITGTGLGGFAPSFPSILPKLINGDPSAYMPLHRIEFAYQDILQTAVESGIPSAILLLALTFLLVLRAFRNKDSLSNGTGAAVAALSVYGCFDSPLQLPGTLALWWYLAGWLMAGKGNTPLLPEVSSKRGRMGRCAVGFFMAMLGLFQAFRFGLADYHWTRGASAFRANDYPTASKAFESAAFFIPENAKLLSESAKAHLFGRNPGKAMDDVSRALEAGFSFEDLFLKQHAAEQMMGPASFTAGWKAMARDYPGLFTPHAELARYYMDRGDFSSARTELEVIFRIHQHDDTDQRYKDEAARLLRQIPGETHMGDGSVYPTRGKK